MNIKPRAYTYTATNGEEIIVHEPRMKDIGVFLRALPSLIALGDAFKASKAAQEGIQGVAVDIPDHVLQGMFPLFGIMCNITADEFGELPFWDGMAVLGAFNEFVPNQAAATPSNPTPSTDSPQA